MDVSFDAFRADSLALMDVRRFAFNRVGKERVGNTLSLEYEVRYRIQDSARLTAESGRKSNTSVIL